MTLTAGVTCPTSLSRQRFKCLHQLMRMLRGIAIGVA